MLPFVLLCATAQAQYNEWTWMGGSAQQGQDGVYGTLGTPAPGNVPGSRWNAVAWTDNQGKLWLFGGYGLSTGTASDPLNDLWRFDPSTNQWAWIGGSNQPNQPGVYGTLGSPSPTNIPGARSKAAGWTDHSGNLWLFGGFGFGTPPGIIQNDLWKYDPSSNQWTWMAGTTGDAPVGVYGTLGTPAAGNVPPGREDAVTWTDGSGNLWLFGGQANPYNQTVNPSVGLYNDLWKFDVSANLWVWMGGSNAVPSGCGGLPLCGQPGDYGALGTASAGSVPGAREIAVTWTDKAGNLWLFGGYGFDSVGTLGLLNDLWKFSPASGQWTWMGGSNSIGLTGSRVPSVYGVWMTPSASSYPGSRSGAVSWTDSGGHLWLFGGYGYDTTQFAGFLNDLWEFDPDTNQWAWVGGTNSSNSKGVTQPGFGVGNYGTLGVPNFENLPPGRDSAESWVDGNGNFWLFGGRFFTTANGDAEHNDLWEYRPNPSGGSAVATPTFAPNGGTVTPGQTVAISDTTAGAGIYYVVDENTPPRAYTGPITVQNSETITAFAAATGYANSAFVSASFAIPVTPTPIFNPDSGTYADTQSVTIIDSAPNAKIYYRTDWLIPTTSDTLYTGPFNVSIGTHVQAIAVADGYAQSEMAAVQYSIWPPAATNEWAAMGGGSGFDPGIFGTRGTPSVGNSLSSRYLSAYGKDKDGNFWLVGGVGRDAYEVEGFLDDIWKYDPSRDEWTWEGGDNLTPGCDPNCGQAGVYGTGNTPAADNIPGGREGASSWSDSQGKLWFFGGQGYDSAYVFGEMNDLWTFDPVAGQWTWIGGSSTATNCFWLNLGYHCPGPFGVYGSLGVPAPGNFPGGREGAVTWYDPSGNLWMFGGYGIDPSLSSGFYFDDLWRYDASGGLWTWMSGDNNDLNVVCQINPNTNLGADCGHPGIYGQFGVAAPGNNPGSRRGASTWIDKGGNLWLFGGLGSDAAGSIRPLNDFWEFNVSTSQWIWRGGSTVASPCGINWSDPNTCGTMPFVPGVYGTMGVPDVSNIPGFGSELPSWTDKDGNFWLLGGAATDAVWEFNPSANEWTWIRGNLPAQYPAPASSVFEGVPDPKNTPGSRAGSSVWTDNSGTLWLAAGSQSPLILNDFITAPMFSDLWAFHPSAPTPVPSFTIVGPTSPITVVQGGTATLNITSVAGGGFNSPITLSASEQPSGISITFTPASVTGTGSSQGNISADSVVPTGTYTFNVTGSSGNKTATVTLSLVIVGAPAFSLTTSQSSITVNSGKQNAVTLTITPENGFNSAVSFACSGLPASVTCSFDPATLTPSAGPVTTNLTFAAAALASSAAPGSRPVFPALTITLAGLLFAFGRIRRFRAWPMVALVSIALGTLTGCGGGGGGQTGGGGGSPPPITSTITVTGTSGSLQQTVTISLTLN